MRKTQLMPKQEKTLCKSQLLKTELVQRTFRRQESEDFGEMLAPKKKKPKMTEEDACFGHKSEDAVTEIITRFVSATAANSLPADGIGEDVAFSMTMLKQTPSTKRR